MSDLQDAQNDFAARLAKLKSRTTSATQKVETAQPKKQRTTSLFEQASSKGEKQTKTIAKVEDTQIYQILADSATDSETKIDQIVKLLTFNFEDPENQAQFDSLAEVRAIIKALIEDFTEKSKESIEQIKNNPLKELTKNINEVFINYHTLLEGREDLKKRLEIIQGYMDKDEADEKGMMKALSDAQVKRKEKDKLESTLNQNKKAAEEATEKLEVLVRREEQVTQRLAEVRAEPFYKKWFSSAIKEERAALEREQTTLATDKITATMSVEKTTTDYKASDDLLKKFLGDNNYSLYEEILSILDIGNEEFKAKLKQIAEQTLKYIDDTNESLTGIRNQLSLLLEDVKKSVNVSANTGEKITILMNALTKSQDINAKGYMDFKAKSDKAAEDAKATGLEGLDEFEQKRINTKSTEFTAEMQRSLLSTTEVSANVETQHTMLIQFRSDLETGVIDAESQLLKAVATNSATGQTMLQRTERLAAMAQKIVADSMYDNELTTTFTSVVNDFQTQLAQQMQRNNSIKGFSELIGQLTTSLDAKNDASVDLAQQASEWAEKLGENIKKLEQANKNAQEVAAVIAVGEMERRAANQNEAEALKKASPKPYAT